ncbi:MAG: hypothetical protein MOGMAGMI_00987 [Candidatus Omnitrophica bacterium]|nr:hypothetical protein [Candidatus Omnitrophota bacterium]
MSKIIESLKLHQKSGPAKQAVERKTTSVTGGAAAEATRDKLADIYFSARNRSPQTFQSDQPVIIKVVEPPRFLSVLPWMIASLAFLITAFSLFSTKRIFIDINIVDDKNPFIETDRSERGRDYPSPPPTAVEPSGASHLPLKQFVFEGAGAQQSSAEKAGLRLVNTSRASFSRATLPMSEPLDLTGRKLMFEARGVNGGEHLGVALKDTGNVTAFVRGRVFPYPDGLSTEWRRAEVTLTDLSPGFRPNSVQAIRFDYGQKDAGNRPGDIILVRDLRVADAS